MSEQLDLAQVKWRARLRQLFEARSWSWLPWFSLFLLWAVWRLEPFYGVGMACQDQLNFSLQGTGAFWSAVMNHARSQGRVYFLLNKIVDLWLASRPEHWRNHLINISVFALSPCCFAYAVCKAPAQRWLYVGLFLGFAWLGYYHLPPSAYPTVNHAPFLLWALAAFLVRWRSARGEKAENEAGWGLPVVYGLLTYLALFQYEPVACMSLLVLGWVVYSEPHARARRRIAYGWGVGTALYAATYIGWRLRFPTTYDGAIAGAFSLWDVLRVAIAYGLGGLPFSQGYHASQPLSFGDQRMGHVLVPFQLPETATLGVLGALLTLFGALGWLHLYRRAGRVVPGERGSGPVLWFLPFALLLAINGPLGLSVKYKQWVNDLDETYLTSQLALYAWILLATLLLDAAYRRLRVKGLPVVFGMLGLLLLVLGVPVRSHNVQIAARQRSGLARWEAVAALAAYASHLSEHDIVAPDLYYSVFVGEGDWSRYWRRYVRQRFQGDFSFHARPPHGRDFVRLGLYRFDDGRLRALSIQTPASVAIVARPANLPSLIASDGSALPIDGAQAELLGGSGYASVTLDPPAWMIGTDRPLEPVWLQPSRPLSTQP